MDDIGPELGAGLALALNTYAGGWIGALAFLAALVVLQVGKRLKPAAATVASVDKETKL